MSTHDNGQCCAVVFVIVCVLSFILFMTSFVMPYTNRDRYSEELCMVNTITTPESLLNTSDYLWTGCDCGRRCTGETACTKITVDILGAKDNVLLNTHTVSWLSNGNSNTCTYKNSNCGVGIDYLVKSIEQGLEDAAPFQEYKSNNKTFTCYVDSRQTRAYLERDLELGYILWATIPFALCCLLCCCCIGCLVCEKRKEEKKNKVVISNV